MEGHKGGGEVRRVHVLYFLSHNGSIEQPHLIRIHHLHRNGVYLRDVKRWLAELRGKDMPDSFSWSYKRRYKSGYVWQDLMDNELITPISDNEYVLKGSELSSKTDLPQDAISSNEEGKHTSPGSLPVEIDECASPKPLPKPDQESPGALQPPPLSGSDASDDSAKRGSIIKIDLWKQQPEQEKEECTSFEEGSGNECSSNKFRSRSGRRTSRLFRNLFKCSIADTKDTALVTVQRQERYQAVSGGSCKNATVVDMFRNEKHSTQDLLTTDSR